MKKVSQPPPDEHAQSLSFSPGSCLAPDKQPSIRALHRRLLSVLVVVPCALLLSHALFPAQGQAHEPLPGGIRGNGWTVVTYHDEKPEAAPETHPALHRTSPRHFRRGDQAFLVEGTWVRETWGIEENAAILTGVSVAYGYHILNSLSLLAEGLLLGARQEDWNTFMGGICIRSRWVFLQRRYFSLFMDAGVGVSMATRRIPETRGTHFNFLILGGPGVILHVRDAWMITGGFHYLHISNSSIAGSGRNPSLDAAGFRVGIQFPF